MKAILDRDSLIAAIASRQWPFRIRQTPAGNLLLKLSCYEKAIVTRRNSLQTSVRYFGSKAIFEMLAAARAVAK